MTGVRIHHSLVPAKVTKSYDELGRVKVRFPWMGKDDESDWIVVLAPMSGKERGVFFMPEENDQVLVAYSHSHVERSYILGAFWSDNNKPPDKDRAKRQIYSKGKSTIILDDTENDEKIIIRDSAKNEIILKVKDKKIEITSKGDLNITSSGNLTIKSDKDVSIQGQNVKVEAQTKLTAKGNEMALNGPSGVKINDGALEVT